MTTPLALGPLTLDALARDPRLSDAVASGDHPLALLPVRLETRYAAGPDGTRELRVRIYPDQVHVDAHDPKVTAQEEEAGRSFWRAQWQAGPDTDRQQRAWRALAERFGPGRAAWVARVTTPLNPGGAEPSFPQVALAEVPRTPSARLLPTRWTATAYADGQVLAVASGRPVLADPAVGPDLTAPLVHADADDDEVAALDTGMNWLVDFEAAEAQGMALRLPVSGPVDLLVVSGVRDATPQRGTAGLSDLLDAHRYSDGVGLLRAGTATNNAEGAPSGWSSADDGAWVARPAPLDDNAGGARAAAALGIVGDRSTALFAPLTGSRDADDRLAASMSRALWPATWGYWLSQFVRLGTDGLTLDDLDWAREHARRFVRSEGPLPTLRVGRQPYGLLPVTSLGRFAGDPRESRLRRILVGLVDRAWRPAVEEAPRVGRGDPGTDLVEVLRLGAHSDRVRLRRSFGEGFADSAHRFLGRDLRDAGFWIAARDRALPIARASGLGPLAAALSIHEPNSWPVTVPLVSGDPTDLGYLAGILSADPDALAREADAAPPALLAALVRHGLLREHAAVAARLLAAGGSPELADEELYGFGEAALGWTARRDQRLPTGETVRERIAAGTDPVNGDVHAFRAAVADLADASPVDLERHLMGTLDLASHRVDAWVTSLATRRLGQLRDAQPSGLQVGGYGWAEQLTPAADVVAASVVPDEPGPLISSAGDPGFLHAPSLHQAEVAALLRNAHLAHGGTATGPFAISITSERVRLARRIFDGVRAGRSLGAVLGYLVERDLHERGLDHAVDNARELAPLLGQEDLPVSARRLDGMRLHQFWADSEGHALDHLVGGNPTASERDRATAVLRRLGVAVDAASDLLQAEQVHQFARGNLTRAVSSLADIDRGLAPPPDLDVIRTPRTGASVTHRVGVLLDPDARAEGWAPASSSVRAASEPALDAWLARCLGPADGRTVDVGDAADPGSARTVGLAALSLSATDLVRIAGAAEEGLAELAARAAALLTPPPRRPVVLPGRDLLDLLEVGRSLWSLVTAATPLDGAALQPPHAEPAPGIDVDELRERAAVARVAVRSVVDRLEAALSADPPAPDALWAALAAVWPLGVGDAALPAEGTVATWVGAAGRARAQLLARLAEADAGGVDLASEATEAQRLHRTLRVLLGPGFVALPRFVPVTAPDLAASRADPALVGDDALAAEVWLTRMERAREPLRRLGIALREAEAVGGAPLDLAVAQVPHVQGARWNALPAPAYVDGAVSLLLQGGERLASGGPLCGLLVDEWTEIVPSAAETTGIAFRYDPPDLAAPQAILLAVPPVVGEPWTVGTLNQVLIETLELAHLRAVPPEALDAVRQYLPATVLAFNTETDAVSTNPNALSKEQGA